LWHLPLTHEIPTWKAFGNRGEAWALQIAGTERGSGSGDLRGFFHTPNLISIPFFFSIPQRRLRKVSL